jgi:hypothetical protein
MRLRGESAMPKRAKKRAATANMPKPKRVRRTVVENDVQANLEALARQFLDVEGDVRDLCRAVKVVSSVITDQLADPIGGEPVTSDYGLEVQTFHIDADMLRFAVDHATELALAVKHKMQ